MADNVGQNGFSVGSSGQRVSEVKVYSQGTAEFNVGGTASLKVSSTGVQTPNLSATSGTITTLNATTGTFGTMQASVKMFDVPHPSQEGLRLRHGSLEGPEFGVYIRGTTRLERIVPPAYWADLIDADSITVTITPMGEAQNLWVEYVSPTLIIIATDNYRSMRYSYLVMATRKDVPALQPEYQEGDSIGKEDHALLPGM